MIRIICTYISFPRLPTDALNAENEIKQKNNLFGMAASIFYSNFAAC